MTLDDTHFRYHFMTVCQKTLSVPFGWHDRQVKIVMIEWNGQTVQLDSFQAENFCLPPSIQRSVVRRQAEFFYGRFCAKRSLSMIGVGTSTVAIGSRGEPIWPLGVLGSISHTLKYAAAVALPSAGVLGVGIDIEHLHAFRSERKMLDLVFGPEEISYIARQPGAACDGLFAIAFSAKEAFYKAAYPTVRAYFDFSAVEVTAVDWVALTIRLDQRIQLTDRLPAGAEHFVSFRILDDTHCVTCCLL